MWRALELSRMARSFKWNMTTCYRACEMRGDLLTYIYTYIFVRGRRNNYLGTTTFFYFLARKGGGRGGKLHQFVIFVIKKIIWENKTKEGKGSEQQVLSNIAVEWEKKKKKDVSISRQQRNEEQMWIISIRLKWRQGQDSSFLFHFPYSPPSFFSLYILILHE